jgi:mitochondrial chaperone BCS1
LAKKGLDDSSLNELICELPSRSIALMEDIDAAFGSVGTARKGVAGAGDVPGDGSGTAPQPGAGAGPGATKETETKGVTLSGLLGALDGVAAQEGRILFATTNRYEALDEALCRAGRMDVHVEFKKATRWQARELFRCFFPPCEEEEGEGEETAKGGDKGKGSVVEKSLQQEGGGGDGSQRLTQEESDALAERFADAVPPGKFSMASLQGHLMRYKQLPREAVESVPEWIVQESRKRGVAAREGKEKAAKQEEVKEEVKEKEVKEGEEVKKVEGS